MDIYCLINFTHRKRLRILAWSTVMMAFPVVCQSATFAWTNPLGGDWLTASNWNNPPLLPGAGDTVLFGLGSASPYSVALSSSTTISSLFVRNDRIRLRLQGNTLNSGQIGVADESGQFGSMVVSGPGLINGNGNIIAVGVGVGSTGSLTFTDGAAWSGAGIQVGQFSSYGEINVLNGSKLTGSTLNIARFAGSSGYALVSGAGSAISVNNVNIGINGIATADILSGGTINSQNVYIATMVGSTGALTVHGSGSKLIATGSVAPGISGTGTLNVLNGAYVKSLNSNVGFNNGSKGVINIEGEGSKMEVTDSMAVGGNIADGEVNILAGARLTVGDDLSVSTVSAASIAKVVVDGAGSELHVADTFTITGAAPNSIVVSNGGKFVDKFGRIGHHAEIGAVSKFTVKGEGSQWINTDGLSIGYSSGGWIGSSVLEVTDRGHVHGGQLATLFDKGVMNLTEASFASTKLVQEGVLNITDSTIDGEVRLESGSTTTVNGTGTFNGFVSGPGQIGGTGNHIIFNGGYAPGASPGYSNFGGDVTFGPGGILFIEIGGLTRGSQFDAIDISGTLHAGGTLNVALFGSYVPTYGDRFEILHFGNMNGAFSFTGLSIGNGLHFDTVYDAHSMTLVVVPEPASMIALSVGALALLRRRSKR